MRGHYTLRTRVFSSQSSSELDTQQRSNLYTVLLFINERISIVGKETPSQGAVQAQRISAVMQLLTMFTSATIKEFKIIL